MQTRYNQQLYTDTSFAAAELVTRQFSSSFYRATTLIDQPYRNHIYNIYGLVRIADELVDSWRPDKMTKRLATLEAETLQSIKSGYSENLIVHAFSTTARKYNLEIEPIEAFFASMRMDISKHSYSKAEYDNYIYGSAQAVGLMCLSVFCDGKASQYQKLISAAEALGAAFQKVNFLRDLGSDQQELSRQYFPNIDFTDLSQGGYMAIINEIEVDFEQARLGVDQLPKSVRYGVLLAMRAYMRLLAKLAQLTPQQISKSRVSLSGPEKAWILLGCHLAKLFGR